VAQSTGKQFGLSHFVTANSFSSDMGGVYGADNLCRFDPANPDGSGRGKARRS
jgi:hypothetical protein